MLISTTSTFATSSVQQRSSLRSAANNAASLVMPKPFSNPGLPLPSSSKQRHAGGPLGSFSPRTRKRITIAALWMVGIFLFTSVTGIGPSFSFGGSIDDSKAWAVRQGESQAIKHNHAGINAPKTPPAAMATRYGKYGEGYERDLNAFDEEHMLAENEIDVDNQLDAPIMTEEEREAEKHRKQQKAVTRATNKKDHLRALIRWLEMGGQLPVSGYNPLTEKEFKQLSGNDFETYLMGLEDAFQPSPNPFEVDGWEKKADYMLALTIFSKSYCPYSMNAKKIIGEYAIQPSPFIIELDQRDDGSYIQDLLKALTGRRTVPNVIAQFESIGGSDEVSFYHHEGTLRKKIQTYSLISRGGV